MDKPVIMNMTGDEFKRLVEQRDPNELINTIPEILDFLQGIRDGETLREYIYRIMSEIFKVTETPDGNILRIVLDDNVNR